MGMWIVDNVDVALSGRPGTCSQRRSRSHVPSCKRGKKSSTRYRISPFRGQLPILRASTSQQQQSRDAAVLAYPTGRGLAEQAGRVSRA